MTFRFGGKAAREAAAIGHRVDAESPELLADLRRQRLILTVAGSVAFSGLAMLAYHYTAPFADPPGFAVSAQATAVAAPRAVVAAPEETADLDVAAEQAEPAAAPDEPVVAAVAPYEPVVAAAEPATTGILDAVANPVDTAATEKIEVLDPNDPRWSSSTAAVTPAPAPRENGELAYAAGNRGADAFKRTVLDGPTDSTETSAVPQPRPAIEAIRPEQPAAAGGRAPSRTATIASAVNMRASGAKGARVLAVIPRGATVGLVDCDGWCEVIYEGRRGFIYKSFIASESRVAEASEPAAPRKTAKPVVVAPGQKDLDQIGR